MLIKKKPVQKTALEETIETLLLEMSLTESTSDEFGKLLDRLEKLHKMKAVEKDSRNRVSPDAILTVGANLAGIVLILGFERAHIVTSKALSFVLKTKA